jgi:hypothetical protein
MPAAMLATPGGLAAKIGRLAGELEFAAGRLAGATSELDLNGFDQLDFT